MSKNKKFEAYLIKHNKKLKCQDMYVPFTSHYIAGGNFTVYLIPHYQMLRKQIHSIPVSRRDKTTLELFIVCGRNFQKIFPYFKRKQNKSILEYLI